MSDEHDKRWPPANRLSGTRLRGALSRAKPKWIGTIEATDEREAIDKAAKEFRTHASKLIAVRRRSLILRPREKTPRVC